MSLSVFLRCGDEDLMLRVERASEGRPRFAASDVGGEPVIEQWRGGGPPDGRADGSVRRMLSVFPVAVSPG